MKRYIGSFIALYDDYDLKMTDVLADNELEARILVVSAFDADILSIETPTTIHDFNEIMDLMDYRVCVMEVR